MAGSMEQRGNASPRERLVSALDQLPGSEYEPLKPAPESADRKERAKEIPYVNERDHLLCIYCSKPVADGNVCSGCWSHD